MKKACISALVPCLLLCLISCGQKSAPSQTGGEGKASRTRDALVTDGASGFCILSNLALYDVNGTTPKAKTSLQLGEKLELSGQTMSISLWGKPKELAHVRRDSGEEGWALADYLVANSILAVVTAEEVMIYSQPKNTAVTTESIPRMSVIAINKSSAGQEYIKATFYKDDPKNPIYRKDAFLRNTGISSRADDVQSVILILLTRQSKNQKQQETFLQNALSDYPSSTFAPMIQEMLASLKSPTAGKSTLDSSVTLVSREDKANVRSIPDESLGSVVGFLAKGQEVEAAEKTVDDYPIGDMSAPWFRIINPAGWVFGGYLVEKQPETGQ